MVEPEPLVQDSKVARKRPSYGLKSARRPTAGRARLRYRLAVRRTDVAVTAAIQVGRHGGLVTEVT